MTRWIDDADGSVSVFIGVFADHDFFMVMMQNDGTPCQSDAKGRLKLPSLPSDAILSIAVTHPEFAVGQIMDIELFEISVSNLEFQQGTKIEA